jgi:uncharacterized membrane protein YozB (DUF420 family)
MLDAPLQPTLNAALNGASAICLLTGWWLIRRRQWRAHRAAMLCAVALSTAFLVSYLAYHAQVGSVRFQGEGGVRTLYLAILLTHTVLAAVVPFAVAVALVRALRGHYDRHRAVARWTMPVWLYVSVTGVVIYLMLYTLGR